MRRRDRLPNALVVGAPRSGTTSLYFYLRQHPDIFLPSQKELHYFTYHLLAANSKGPGDKEVLIRLCKNWKQYVSYYASAKSQAVLGEISPSYLYYCEASDYIRSKLGSIKIIMLLRNPIDRSYSQYMLQVRQNLEPLSFYEALMAEEKRKSLGWSDIWRYSETSLFVKGIEKYLDVFGEDNVLIILAEEFFSKPEAVMHRIFEFLGVEAEFRPDVSKKYNVSGVPRSRSLARFLNKPTPIRKILWEVFPPNIRRPFSRALQNANLGEKPEIESRSRTFLTSIFHDHNIEVERLMNRKTGWQ